MIVKVKVKDIRGNPKRDQGIFKLDKERLQTLEDSIGSTGFWDNLLARRENGHIELAYGHHRLAALRNKLGPNAVVPINVKPLSDADMIRIMIDENDEWFGSRTEATVEAIRGIVQDFADGAIKLPKPPKSLKRVYRRFAPSFRLGHVEDDDQLPYTADTIADFLRWKRKGQRHKVKLALQVLQAVEEGVLDYKSIRGLSIEQAKILVSQAQTGKRRARSKGMTESEAAEVGKNVGKKTEKKMKGGASVREARTTARKEVKTEGLPFISEHLSGTCKEIARIFAPKSQLRKKVEELTRYQKEMAAEDRARLFNTLIGLSEQAERLASKIKD